jgi:hypothetical protein
MIISREVLTRFLKDGIWLRGGPTTDPEHVAQIAQRLIDEIASGEITLAVTDEPLGEINILAQEEGDVMLESTRHRATDTEKARLGLVLRGRSTAEAFVSRFDALWDSLPPADRSADDVVAWIEKTSGVTSPVA